MKIITVDEIGLIESFATFGVKFNYSRLFLSKCHVSKGRVALTPFMFNDTVHLDNPHQWFAANIAFGRFFGAGSCSCADQHLVQYDQGIARHGSA